MDESNTRPKSVSAKMAAAAAVPIAPPEFQFSEAEGLVARMAAGDHEALAGLYDRTCGLLYALALRILRNPADAEEVVHDAYARAWRNAGRYDAERGSVQTWLVLMTRSIAIDHIRSSRAAEDRTAPLEPVLDATPAPGNPETDTVQSQRRHRIRQCLAQLPSEQRKVIELAFFSGYSHSELAARLGLPLGTLKTRIRLGLARLRFLLEDLQS